MPKTKEKCMEIREEMRGKILRKSLLYFARNGFAGTKISDLSNYIGIAQGTIYLYYESKDELFKEIMNIADYKQEIKSLKLLINLPLSATYKLRSMSETVMKKLAEDELFAAKVTLNTQLLLENSSEHSMNETGYQSELYSMTAKIIEQGQREGSMADGSAIKLADYYWGVVYLYALKRLFTTQYQMITVEDLERTVLK